MIKFAAALVFSAFVIQSSHAQNSAADQRKNAVDNSAKILGDLYITLRNLVFPKDPLSTGPAQNRFVMMSPGKVLNYWDYYPGRDYEESLLKLNMSAPEVPIPPSVMEKWFDIADVTVGADPFTGGVSGRSMARAYETILSQMQLLGLETKSSNARTKYNVAQAYLTQSMTDPDNMTVNITKLSLYERYQEQYADRKLDMEEQILNKRLSSSATEYQLWFQRNYPSLNAKVESAYMKWLSFGEKDLVELYKAYLDSTSSGAEVEEARMSLRASGVTSLDRTRTVYPVSFEPGNWYKYLLPKQRGPSRDMLIAKKSMAESERDALKSMITFNNQNKAQSEKATSQLETKLGAATNQTTNKTNEAGQAFTNCLSSNSNSTSNGTTSQCQDYQKAKSDAVTASFQQAQVKSEYESAQFLLNSKGQFNGFLGARVDALERELASLNAQLNTSSNVHLGGLADSREFQNLNKLFNETEQSLDDNWLEFEYDSDSSHINTQQDTSSLNIAAGIGIAAPGVASFDGGFSYGKGTTDLKQALNSASLKVSGSILRVVIKRPWFKPSLFSDPSLSFVQRDEVTQKNTYVSPGPRTDKELKSAIGGETGSLFLMPEYVTSFLLGRDVRLEFSGLDANSVSHAMQSMVGASFSASYDMFSMSAAVGIGKTKQSVNADRTANGMIINIPGAQVIGYYTEVLPTFPRAQQ